MKKHGPKVLLKEPRRLASAELNKQTIEEKQCVNADIDPHASAVQIGLRIQQASQFNSLGDQTNAIGLVRWRIGAESRKQFFVLNNTLRTSDLQSPFSKSTMT